MMLADQPVVCALVDVTVTATNPLPHWLIAWRTAVPEWWRIAMLDDISAWTVDFRIFSRKPSKSKWRINHDQSWSIMINHDQPWSILIHGYTCYLDVPGIQQRSLGLGSPGEWITWNPTTGCHWSMHGASLPQAEVAGPVDGFSS